MSQNFRKIDLHVHTPSSKCYVGPSNDEEYLKLLKKAIRNKIAVIAITDHNTIDGYKKLISLRDSFLKSKANLSAIADSKQSRAQIAKINKTLDLFSKVLILPGVEIEVRPGIHMLVIFNNKIGVEQIELFLYEGGYGGDIQGVEDPAFPAKWDVLDLYESSKNFDCIVIDPHTDSDKGILNSTQKGNYRAECFRSDQLVGVCYKNESQKDKLSNTMASNSAYARKTPISFLKFSDSHKCEDIGKKFTWANLKNVDYSSLKSAFANPTENISVIQPSISKILDKLINLKNSLGVSDLSDDSVDLIAKYVCALNNTEGGFILIGVSERKNRIGIAINGNGLESSIDDHMSKLEKSMKKIDIGGKSKLKLKINPYPISNNRIILSLFIEASNVLFSLKGDGRIYAVRNGMMSTLAINEVQSMIEERTTNEIEKRIQRKIEKIEKECRVLTDYFCSLPLINKIESNGMNLFNRLKFHVKKCIILADEDIVNVKKMNSNGVSRGNVSIFLEKRPPRYEYSYLRYSVPKFNLKNVSKCGDRRETIYVVPGGGVFWSTSEIVFASDNEYEVLELSSNSSNYSNKFIASFLKSSFCLWYCINKFESINLFRPNIFEDIIVPKINASNNDQKSILNAIEKYFDKIIDLERKYLVSSKSGGRERLIQLVEEHNSAVDKIAYAIDRKIFDLFELSHDEIAVVENNLISNDIYLPQIDKES